MGRQYNFKHGMYNTPEHRAWCAMRDRCLNLRHYAWENYGGRGITVCDRWKDSFENFYADMGKRPSSKHSLDRIDNDKGYEPGNCRWATQREQKMNTRRTRYITFRGETLSLAEWSKKVGVSPTTLSYRIDRYQWSLEDALTKPLSQGNRPDGVRTGRRFITYNGETLSLADWARRKRISQKVLTERLDRYGWPIEKAFSEPNIPGVPLGKRGTVSWNGECLSYAEWSKKTGIKRELIWERINRYGWPVERALTEPVLDGVNLKHRG